MGSNPNNEMAQSSLSYLWRLWELRQTRPPVGGGKELTYTQKYSNTRNKQHKSPYLRNVEYTVCVCLQLFPLVGFETSGFDLSFSVKPYEKTFICERISPKLATATLTDHRRHKLRGPMEVVARHCAERPVRVMLRIIWSLTLG